MSDVAQNNGKLEEASLAESMSRFLSIARRYWREDEARKAWLLTAGVILFVIISIGIQVAINQWNRYFFDGIDRRDTGTILFAVPLIFGLVIAAAVAAVALVHFRMRLQLRWRQWLTRKMIGYWFADRRFYQLTIVGGEDSNPEYRIADDIRMATEPVVDFVVGLLTAVLMAAAFLGILWAVGGSISIPLFGGHIAIPGYMLWLSLAYSIAASGIMYLVGKPLVTAVAEKNGGEAQLRYELTRVRESAETIALIGGDEDEIKRLDQTFSELASRWIKVIAQQARMTWISNGNSVLAPVVPLLACAPKYLSGEMTLGEMMQIAAAFVQVQTALNYLVDNAIRIAEWNASAHRVGELAVALSRLDAGIGGVGTDTIVLGVSPDDKLRLENVTIAQPDGKLMIAETEVVIEPGERILVKGESGSGKSTLIRAMAGLWPWGTGSILRPEGMQIAFMPQRPYIPLGNLRHALLYPSTEATVPDSALIEALEKVGLDHLTTRLEEDTPWSRTLSGGEQQRLAFARLLVSKPQIIIMDEATSALDELSQARVMDFLRSDLAGATVVNVAHRPGLEAYHTREIHIKREAGTTHSMAQDRQYGIVTGLFSRMGRWLRA